MWFLHQGITVEDMLMHIFASLVVIFLVMPLHEYAHGFVAYKLGDNTAKNSGRLSFNPLRHVNPFGALAILLFGIGWAEPVPVNEKNFKNPRLGMALTALAGPVSNLLAAMIGGVFLNILFFYRYSLSTAFLSVAGLFFHHYTFINVALAIFNLLPLPPLDGSRVVGAFLTDKALYSYYRAQKYIMIIVVVLLLTGVLSWPLMFLNKAVYDWVISITSIPFKG